MKYYTVKEYAELKGFSLKVSTRMLLGRNAEKFEKSGKFEVEKKWKHEDGMFKRGRKKGVNGKKIFVPFKRQPGVRIWPIEILKEAFNEN